MSLTTSFTLGSLGTVSRVFALSLAILDFSALSLTGSFTCSSVGASSVGFAFV